MAQAAALHRLFPGSTVAMRRGVLTWRGNLRPTEISLEYRVEIKYSPQLAPKVRVTHPALERREGKRPPHMYRGELLCLYYPEGREWAASMLLAESIVPWSAEWLFFYESWLLTGEWDGGGIHPPTR